MLSLSIYTIVTCILSFIWDWYKNLKNCLVNQKKTYVFDGELSDVDGKLSDVAVPTDGKLSDLGRSAY